MATPFEFSPEALTMLSEQEQLLIDEQEEVVAARAKHTEETRDIAAQQVAVAQERAQATLDTTTRVSQNLTDIEASLARGREIQDSFALKLLEPLATVLGMENNSRQLIATKIARSQQDINIQKQRDELAQSNAIARGAILDQKAKAADDAYNAEVGEVATIQQLLEYNKSAFTDIAAMKAEIVARTKSKDLPQLATQIGLSEEEVTLAQQGKESQELSMAQQRRADVVGHLSTQQTQLRAMTPEQLADPNVLKEFPAELVRNAKRDKALEQIAYDQAARVEAFATRADEELIAMGAQGKDGVTPHAAKTEVDARAQKALNAERERAVGLAQASELWLTTQPPERYIELLQQAVASGTNSATVDTPSGAKLTFTVTQLRSALAQKESETVDLSASLGSSELTQKAMGVQVGSWIRANGGIDDPNAPLEQRVGQLADNPHVSPETQKAAAHLRNQLKASENAITALGKIDIQEQAAVFLDKAANADVEKRVALQGKSNKEATVEYVKTGRITSNENAIGVISTAAIFNEAGAFNNMNGTLPRPYAEAMKSVYDLAFRTNAEGEKQVDLQKLMMEKAATPAEIVAMRVREDTVQEKIASPIIADLLQRAHIVAARAAGDPELAAAVATGTIFRNGQFDSSAIAAWIQSAKSKVQMDTYIQELGKAARLEGRAATMPYGEAGEVMAALNRTLFANQTEEYAYQFATQLFAQGVRDTTDQQRIAKLRGDPSQLGGL